MTSDDDKCREGTRRYAQRYSEPKDRGDDRRVIELTVERVMGRDNIIMKSKPRHSLFGLLPDPIPSIGTRASGGIGRRAGFRCLCPSGCEGSSPSSRTQICSR